MWRVTDKNIHLVIKLVRILTVLKTGKIWPEFINAGGTINQRLRLSGISVTFIIVIAVMKVTALMLKMILITIVWIGLFFVHIWFRRVLSL